MEEEISHLERFLPGSWHYLSRVIDVTTCAMVPNNSLAGMDDK